MSRQINLAPVTRTSQPQFPITINSANALAKGLCSMVYPNSTPSPALGANNGLAPRLSLAGKTEIAYINSLGNNIFISVPSVSSSEWTFMVLGQTSGLAQFEALVDFHSANHRTAIHCRSYPSSQVGIDSRPYAQDQQSSTPVTVNEQTLLIATISVSGNNISLYKNKTLIYSNTLGSSAVSTVDEIELFGKGGGIDSTNTGAISLAGFWNRALSQAEVSALFDNPWQVFR